MPSGIRLGQSPIHGRGVYATKNFAPGETVEVCPMLEVNANDIGGKLQDYVYMGDNEQLRCIVMGYGMMYNSSQDANLTYHRAPNGDFVYTAVRHIRAGEE
eukprot:CAMPEP_0174290862 /NCGR_PEP_ID=MMETSP0809-20121228/30388_1 /TAXON_ID=73025 ORGANISM="Eutreptiella gymnastica-like, Strain CCMP1594" /NCGR_SAMPLE_ID=MMETSP0809 /ASSEMBLY_ACC=CAM_ASM_000658 /LENGTH=100 /DNA_ID=CAMNT_0015389855 /DNA_START=32 /DNA_END=331 /DNA_ORIENTATION=-